MLDYDGINGFMFRSQQSGGGYGSRSLRSHFEFHGRPQLACEFLARVLHLSPAPGWTALTLSKMGEASLRSYKRVDFL